MTRLDYTSHDYVITLPWQRFPKVPWSKMGGEDAQWSALGTTEAQVCKWRQLGWGSKLSWNELKSEIYCHSTAKYVTKSGTRCQLQDLQLAMALSLSESQNPGESQQAWKNDTQTTGEENGWRMIWLNTHTAVLGFQYFFVKVTSHKTSLMRRFSSCLRSLHRWRLLSLWGPKGFCVLGWVGVR